jgi:hypothetical protein
MCFSSSIFFPSTTESAMSTKTYEKLVHVNYTAGAPVTPQMIVADFNEYLLPLEKLVNKALHGWGVASGLDVTVVADGAGVQVAPSIDTDSFSCSPPAAAPNWALCRRWLSRPCRWFCPPPTRSRAKRLWSPCK